MILNDKDGLDVNIMIAVPTIYDILMEYYDKNNMQSRSNEILHKCKDFRLMVSGSAALPEKSLLRWREISGHTLLESFGMAEIGMALTNPYSDVNARHPGFVGHPF